jgi:hypothetical protein
MVFVKRPGLVGNVHRAEKYGAVTLLADPCGSYGRRWAMMEAISDELNDLGYCPECRLEYAFNTATRVYGRPEVLFYKVPNLTFLIMNCCLEFKSFCSELSKLTELVLEDSLNVAIWMER